MKTELLEGDWRIPAIVRWPGHVSADSINERQTIIRMDWLPTLLAATGAVPDALERANLKDRQPDIFARLVAEYRAWRALAGASHRALLPRRYFEFTAA
jgi:arylsulfatase A-like enzyme